MNMNNETINFPGIADTHVVGDSHCNNGWCGVGVGIGSDYPRLCSCGGLIHADYVDDYEGDQGRYEKCDQCGGDFEEATDQLDLVAT